MKQKLRYDLVTYSSHKHICRVRPLITLSSAAHRLHVVTKHNLRMMYSAGGRIDHAHHYNNAYRALDETLALEEAVRAVMKEVDLSETLLVVTADHSHVLTLGGLATHRGNPIFGK